jgi:hypothetical protein
MQICRVNRHKRIAGMQTKHAHIAAIVLSCYLVLFIWRDIMYVLTTYSPCGDILAKYEFRTRDEAQYFADHYDLETPGLNLKDAPVDSYTIEAL